MHNNSRLGNKASLYMFWLLLVIEVPNRVLFGVGRGRPHRIGIGGEFFRFGSFFVAGRNAGMST